MNDQEVPTPEPARRRKSPLVVLLLVLACAAVAYVVVTMIGGPGADPAALIPKEVAVAVTVDFTRSQDKDAAVAVIKGIFESCGVKDPEKKLYEELDKGLDIKVEKDVLPKLSGVGAVAVLTEMNGFMPSMAFIVGAKDAGAASDLLKLVTGKMEAQKMKLDRLEYEGFTYYRLAQAMPMGQVAFYMGAVKNAFVGTIGESAFKKIADTAKGKPSLLDDANFTRLRKTSDATFATVFFSGAGYYKLVGPLMSMGMGMMAPDAADTMKEYMENNVASVGVADASSEGLKFSAYSLTKKDVPGMQEVSIDDLAAVAPKDAALLFAIDNFDVAWKEIKRQLTAGPGFKTQIDQMLQQAKQMLKMDPFADALDRIKSIGGYYVPKPALNPQGCPGSIVIVLKVDKPDLIAKSLAKVHAAATTMGGYKLTTVPMDGFKVAVGPASPDATRFWDALSGDKVILGITGVDFKTSAKDAIALAGGKGATAASSDGFQLVKKQLPAKSAFLFYGDATPIVNAFKKDMSAEDRKVAESITKTVGTMGMTGSAKGKESEMQCVMPFRK